MDQAIAASIMLRSLRRVTFAGSMGRFLRSSDIGAADIAGNGPGAKDNDPSKSAMTHSIGFFLYPGFQLLDLAGPLDAFQAANEAAGRTLYRTIMLSRQGGQVLGSAEVVIATTSNEAGSYGTLMVLGGDVARMLCPEEVAAVRHLAAGAPRLASVCTGAFLLAEAGLLDGRRATTHWSCVRALRQRFPSVTVEADRIFVADGPVWTSAGIIAGIDLALALIETDHGVDLARAVARELVVYHRRPGGQSQFSAMSDLGPVRR